MLRQLPAFPSYHRHDYTVVWGARELRLTLTWRPRLRAWYVDIDDADGKAVVRGRRISPGFGPLRGLALAEQTSRTELLVIDGPEPYDREQLGDVVRMMLLDTTQFEAPATSDPHGPGNLFILEVDGG